MLHGVRVRVSPSAPNLKKADFMSAFFMSKICRFDDLFVFYLARACVALSYSLSFLLLTFNTASKQRLSRIK